MKYKSAEDKTATATATTRVSTLNKLKTHKRELRWHICACVRMHTSLCVYVCGAVQ